MKTVILFAVILGVLSGGVYYYVQQKTPTNVIEEQQNIPSLSEPITVKHPQWKDQLLPVQGEPGRVKREANSDYATILELTPDSITISWDRWGIETFKKNKEGIFVFVKES